MILREMLEATYRRRQNHELLQARTIRIQRPSRTEHHQVLQKSTTWHRTSHPRRNKNITTKLGIDDRVDKTASWALWHGLDDSTCVRSLGVAIWPYLHPSISTALMRPRRPKQYCLQLVIYIYTHTFLKTQQYTFWFLVKKNQKIYTIEVCLFFYTY